MSRFEISWTDRVGRSVEIDARSKTEALNKWRNGDFDTSDICENDCETISENNEIEIEEVK